MPSLFRSPGIMDACWREWCNQDGCDLVAIATASSSAAVTANEDKNSLNSVPWQTKPNLKTQQGYHISTIMKQADHLPPLIPKQMPLPSSLCPTGAETEASWKTQNLIHAQIYSIKHTRRCKMNTIKHGFIQTNTKSVPCPLQLLQVHSFFPLSMSVVSLAAVVFLFSLSQILYLPETHYLTRPNGMNGQKGEKRAEERQATVI